MATPHKRNANVESVQNAAQKKSIIFSIYSKLATNARIMDSCAVASPIVFFSFSIQIIVHIFGLNSTMKNYVQIFFLRHKNEIEII